MQIYGENMKAGAEQPKREDVGIEKRRWDGLQINRFLDNIKNLRTRFQVAIWFRRNIYKLTEPEDGRYNYI